jgi:poly(A) polymerase
MYLNMNQNTWTMLQKYPEELIQALADLMQEKSDFCYISGGTVRDWFMGEDSKDLDLTVPDDGFSWAKSLADKLGGTFVPMDEEEDVARVVWQGISVDFSSFREGTATIEEDLLKRDFTINSMAVVFPVDPDDVRDETARPRIFGRHRGMDDLQDKVIRCTSSAVFVSDPLRLLRAYRFTAVLGFNIEPGTRAAIRKHKELLFLVAEERIAYELDCIMSSSRSVSAMEIMHEDGILAELLPELYRGVGVEQPSSHHLDVFEHSMTTFQQMIEVQNNPEKYFPGHGGKLAEYLAVGRRKVLLKWAALLHDLGKPETHEIREDKGGRITFYNHDQEGARLFEIISARFKWSREDSNYVSKFISFHMWPFHLNNARRKTGLTPKAYLRLVKAIEREFPGLFLLAMADSLAGCGTGKPPAMEEDVASLYSEVDRVYQQKIQPVLESPRLLDGSDLIELFGLEPGPVFKEIFENLENGQVEGEVNSRQEAIDWIREFLQANK